MRRKIRNVPLHICRCEQMIAYNYAFSYEGTYDIWKRDYCDEHNGAEPDSKWTNQAISHICGFVEQDLKRPEFDQYDREVIMEAFRNDFPSYICEPFIATDYEQVGRVFKLGGES